MGLSQSKRPFRFCLTGLATKGCPPNAGTGYFHNDHEIDKLIGKNQSVFDIYVTLYLPFVEVFPTMGLSQSKIMLKFNLPGLGTKGCPPNAGTRYFLTDPELDNLFGNPRYFKLTTYGTLTFENLAQVFLEVKHHSSMYA